RVIPRPLQQVLHLVDEGEADLWQFRSVTQGSLESWFLRRISYKSDPEVYTVNAPRDHSMSVRTRAGLASRRQKRDSLPFASSGLSIRANKVLLPWLRNAPGIIKWAQLVLHGAPKKKQLPESKPPKELPETREAQVPKPPPVTTEPDSLVEDAELLDQIASLNRQAREERLLRREARGQKETELQKGKTPSAERSPSPTRPSRQQRRRECQAQASRHKASLKAREQDLAFLRLCRPALEASKSGPVDHTQIQEDPFPEIERKTRRALLAQAQCARRESKLEKLNRRKDIEAQLFT
ncbi:MAG: hypothetical protein EBZ48_13025, partial [Proteobacteria bacterium]|nr:hypothetical protein [Pseudomonadota bacterium]